MLLKLVVNLYTVLLEIGLWVILLAVAIGGWQTNGWGCAIVGLFGAAMFGAVFFGAFLVLDDIRNRLRAIQNKK